jgi:hypothetical protein
MATDTKEQAAAKEEAKAAVKEQKSAAAKKEAAAAKKAAEEAERTVRVRAVRTGFYPADGRLRNPGDEFDYVLHKRDDGTVEEKLPSWVEDIEGDMESRTPGEPSGLLPKSTLVEIKDGQAAVVKR